MSGDRAVKVVRAAVFTALAVPLSALGQVLVTGRPLPLSLVLVATLAVFLVALAACGARQRGLLHLVAVMVPVELLLNAAFNLGQDACAAPARSVDLLVCGGGSLSGPLFAATPGSAATSAQALVLLVHLALALAAACWLRLGEVALTGLAEALRLLAGLLPPPLRALLLLAPLPLPARALTPPLRAAVLLPRREGVVLTPAPRRGPPAREFALAR
ncbi:hypothetical protein ACIRBX_03980 [Kitasatospora sp. NPDC096147]|uniref:hypothetical protein n=1 Tax=Kitasatospora sp. NPDC096147 TaxID=3364093 RepID=UPI003819D47D